MTNTCILELKVCPKQSIYRFMRSVLSNRRIQPWQKPVAFVLFFSSFDMNCYLFFTCHMCYTSERDYHPPSSYVSHCLLTYAYCVGCRVKFKMASKCRKWYFENCFRLCLVFLVIQITTTQMVQSP